MTHNKSLTAASLLASLLILVAGVTLAGDDDAKVEIHQRHHIKLKLDDEMEMIEIDDLQPGESRQFFTDDGKEIVITRSDDGVEITVDGEEIDLPKMIRFETLTDRIHEGGEHKVVVRTGHGDGANMVWISSDEEGESHVELEHLGEAGHRMHWFSGDGADIQIHRLSATEFLQEKGVLDDLDDADRQAILGALEEFDSEPAARKKIFIGECAGESLHEDH